MTGAVAGREYGRVRVGCCGFPMARADYFRRFPVVEIQFNNLFMGGDALRCRQFLERPGRPDAPAARLQQT